MKKRRSVWFFLCIFLSLLCLTTVGLGENDLALSDLMVDTGYIRLYIKEKDELVPYIATDYVDSQVLLVREHVLDPPMPFSENWDLPAAYPDSNVDSYLNSVFLERFDEGILEEIVDSMIDVTDPENLGRGRNHTIQIQRRVFLLSYTEVGGADVSICPKEGKPLNKLPKGWLVATDDTGNISAWWLRTAITWNYDVVNAVYPDGSINGFDVWGDNAPACLGVRPAFRINKTVNIVRYMDSYRIDC